MILPGTDPAAIAAAAHALRTGALVGLPTETVYGLAADADNPAAVAQIFALKGRPSDHPLIVHVADSDRAAAVAHFASEVPPFAQALMDAFWPGPLTLILPRRAGVATAAAGGQPSVGLRCPAHPVAQAVLRACAAPPDPGKGERHVLAACRTLGVDSVKVPQRGPFLPDSPPHSGSMGQEAGKKWAAAAHSQPTIPKSGRLLGLAAPSANRFGRVSPTTAAHVQAEFGDGLLVLDGGPCAVGIESTIIDCTRGRPVLLRPGAITRAQIAAACGLQPLSKEELPAQTPRASGTLEAHYAPTAKVRLMDARALQTALDVLGADAARLGVYARTPLRGVAPQVVLRRMPEDAAAAAQELFAALRAFDAAGVALIWIETPPDTPAWEGVRDRLQRAAAAA